MVAGALDKLALFLLLANSVQTGATLPVATPRGFALDRLARRAGFPGPPEVTALHFFCTAVTARRSVTVITVERAIENK